MRYCMKTSLSIRSNYGDKFQRLKGLRDTINVQCFVRKWSRVVMIKFRVYIKEVNCAPILEVYVRMHHCLASVCQPQYHDNPLQITNLVASSSLLHRVGIQNKFGSVSCFTSLQIVTEFGFCLVPVWFEGFLVRKLFEYFYNTIYLYLMSKVGMGTYAWFLEILVEIEVNKVYLNFSC